MTSDLDQDHSKISELEKLLSDHDQMARSEKMCYEEVLHVKDREVAKLKDGEKDLTKKWIDAKSLVEHTYQVSWGNAIEQMKHFFTDKDLDFKLLD